MRGFIDGEAGADVCQSWSKLVGDSLKVPVLWFWYGSAAKEL
ncbi:hypothetical protein [Pedobacter sp.]|nr:hypothetical protein [Pedobacter sp.]HWW41308.1 hypothetical protein [Pedobacter sp.]